MRIGIVCYPTFGGSGVVATELGLELSKRGHEIHFITYSQPVRLELLSNNVHYHEVTVPEYALFLYQPYELALSSKLVDMDPRIGANPCARENRKSPAVEDLGSVLRSVPGQRNHSCQRG